MLQWKAIKIWEKAKEHLQEDVGMTTGDILQWFMAKAVSVRDLREEIVKRCPANPVMNGYTYNFLPCVLHLILPYAILG